MADPKRNLYPPAARDRRGKEIHGKIAENDGGQVRGRGRGRSRKQVRRHLRRHRQSAVHGEWRAGKKTQSPLGASEAGGPGRLVRRGLYALRTGLSVFGQSEAIQVQRRVPSRPARGKNPRLLFRQRSRRRFPRRRKDRGGGKIRLAQPPDRGPCRARTVRLDALSQAENIVPGSRHGHMGRQGEDHGGQRLALLRPLVGLPAVGQRLQPDGKGRQPRQKRRAGMADGISARRRLHSAGMGGARKRVFFERFQQRMD